MLIAQKENHLPRSLAIGDSPSGNKQEIIRMHLIFDALADDE